MGILKIFTYAGLIPCLKPCLDVLSNLCWIALTVAGLVITIAFKDLQLDTEKHVLDGKYVHPLKPLLVITASLMYILMFGLWIWFDITILSGNNFSIISRKFCIYVMYFMYGLMSIISMIYISELASYFRAEGEGIHNCMEPYIVRNKAELLLENYLNIQESLQPLLLTEFTCKTFLVTAQLFLSVLTFRQEKNARWHSLFCLCGTGLSLLYTCSLVTTIESFIESSVKHIRKLYYSMSDRKDSKYLKVIFKEMSEAPHFSAFGFVTVDRSLLIASLATGFTYVVVLLQSY